MLSICPVQSVLSQPAYSGYCGLEGDGTGIRWTFDPNTGTLSFEGSGAMLDWRHQTDFDSYDPSDIDYIYTPWYSYRDKILHGVIGDGITVMGNFTFSGCSNLQDVYLSKDLTNIGVGGFESCFSLTKVSVPSKATFVGVGAFYNATALTTVTLPEGLEIIYYGAFAGCESLTALDIPSTVRQINAAAFAYCSGIRSFVIPEGVKGVSSYTFYYCTGLRSIEFLGDITYINTCAFYKCTKLTSFTIMESVTKIAEDAFNSCTRLTLRCYEGSYGETYCKEFVASGRYEVITHNFQPQEVVAPTCTEEGYTLYHCDECDRYRKEDIVAPTGHTYGEWSISAIATPEADGQLVCSCSVCGEKSYKAYPYHMPGDTDLDGQLTIFDSILVLQCIEGTVSFDEYALSAGDLNHNYQIDSEDCTLLMQMLTGKES